MDILRRNNLLSSGGSYDGADRFDRNLALWNVQDTNADQEILPGKSMADARVQDVARNDAYISGGIKSFKDTIVGDRFRLNAKPKFKVLGLDEKWAIEFSEEVEAKFSLWAESDSNWPDAAGRQTLTELVRQAVGIFIIRGEYLATAEWLSRDMSRPVYTAIQPIELNRLSNPYDNQGFFPSFEKNVRGGVRMNSKGKPLGYYIRNRSQSYYAFNSQIMEDYRWSYIRATVAKYGPLSRRPQVLHFVDQGRPAQTRGISDLVAALKSIRMCQKFRDITLQNAAVNASYAATIESEMPSQMVFNQMGGGNVSEEIIKYAQQWLSGVNKYADSAQNIQLDGVKIPHLFPGTSLNLKPAGTVGGVGTEFEQSFLRYIASALGVSYEELSRDYKQVSYSGAKAVINQTQKTMRTTKRFIADRFASVVYRLWLEEMHNRNEITTMVGKPSFYEGLNLDAYCHCEWIGGFASQIDEKKETEAAILRIKGGLSTLEKECARFGSDWRMIIEQLGKEKQIMEAYGIRPAEIEMAQEQDDQNNDRDMDADDEDENNES